MRSVASPDWELLLSSRLDRARGESVLWSGCERSVLSCWLDEDSERTVSVSRAVEPAEAPQIKDDHAITPDALRSLAESGFAGAGLTVAGSQALGATGERISHAQVATLRRLSRAATYNDLLKLPSDPILVAPLGNRPRVGSRFGLHALSWQHSNGLVAVSLPRSIRSTRR